jgi:hypothetical protein
VARSSISSPAVAAPLSSVFLGPSLDPFSVESDLVKLLGRTHFSNLTSGLPFCQLIITTTIIVITVSIVFVIITIVCIHHPSSTLIVVLRPQSRR